MEWSFSRVRKIFFRGRNLQENPCNSAERAILAKFQAPKFENSEPKKMQFHTPSHSIPLLDSLLIQLRRARFQTPSSVSFLGPHGVLGSERVQRVPPSPLFCVPKRTHTDFFRRAHRLWRRTQCVLSSEPVYSRNSSPPVCGFPTQQGINRGYKKRGEKRLVKMR